MTQDERAYVSQKKSEIKEVRRKLAAATAWFYEHPDVHGVDPYVHGQDIALLLRDVADKVNFVIAEIDAILETSHSDPLAPEEELADTIARQKECK